MTATLINKTAWITGASSGVGEGMARVFHRHGANLVLSGRLRKLVWVNDVAIGGSYHVNACIHPIQAMMWTLNKTPVAAVGISRTARPDPTCWSWARCCMISEKRWNCRMQPE